MSGVPGFTADASIDSVSRHYRAGTALDLVTPLNAISPALKPVGATSGGACNASSPIRNTRVLRGTYSCDANSCTCCSGSGETLVCISCDGPGAKCDNGHVSEFLRSPVDFISRATIGLGGAVAVFQ
jgi:hypothetical protein